MTDDERSRLETALWGLVLLVGPIGLVWEFGPALLHDLSTTAGLPLAFIQDISVAMYVLIIVLGGGTLLAFVYAAVRYADTSVSEPETMPVNWQQRTFVMWMGVVIGVLLVTATVGATTLMSVDSGPAPTGEGDAVRTEGALTYKVIGVQWTWMVKPVNPNHLGFAMRRQIRVPANTTIQLQITSKDVIHSFAIQEFGVKKDAVPGQMNSYWFVAREPGRYQINCAELCGAGHSRMTPTLIVMEREEYAEWVVAQGGTNPFESITVNAGGNGTNTTGANEMKAIDVNDAVPSGTPGTKSIEAPSMSENVMTANTARGSNLATSVAGRDEYAG